ncbi:class II aldolase/adducin family protein [Oceanibacterium hippocampi]|uniref:Decarboxylase NovR n=1 Tax=Oceanibacterium hippocampi TaxID=745714 RepID=A0A1Y5S4C5_9PROT|nr:class II aldolase/adducin family protein [Oceanibacterium hippocampi]SLN32330.1 Decarboxylase NovR [Oceanibacterium hippocampi]
MEDVVYLEDEGLRAQVSEDEWRVRVDLAACYRLVAHFGMGDLIFTHISARVPGETDRFLINPYGLMFDEITASSLVKVDMDGVPQHETGYGANPAGVTIHGAIVGARPDVGCVIHTHTRAGMAVSAQADGLLPITQHSLRFYNRIAYHDYEGIADDHEERQRLVADLGDRHSMILRNHGLLVAGRTVQEAFSLIFYLEKSCQAQIDAQSGGAKLTLPSPEMAEHTARQYDSFNNPGMREWPALIRMLHRNGHQFDT